MEYKYLLSIMCAVSVFAGKSKNIFYSKFKGLGLKWKSYFSNIMFTKTEEDNPISAKEGR